MTDKVFGYGRSKELGVDYIYVVVDGIELYAELPCGKKYLDSYDSLWNSILAQAEVHGIEEVKIRFF